MNGHKFLVNWLSINQFLLSDSGMSDKMPEFVTEDAKDLEKRAIR